MPSPTASTRPRLADFWHDLSRDGRLLLSTVAVDALGRGLVLPFAVVYLHDVRHIPLGTVGTVIAVPAMVALLLLGPVGSIIDRFGPRMAHMGGILHMVSSLSAQKDAPPTAPAQEP